MIFEKGSKYSGFYNTPFGGMSVDVTTKDIQVDIDENGGEFRLDYYVQFNHDTPVRNGMHVKIRKVGDEIDSVRTDKEYA